MQLFPSINHENVLTLTLTQWWAIAQSVDAHRKETRKRARTNRHASRNPARSRRR